jgi:hypothetical protein
VPRAAPPSPEKSKYVTKMRSAGLDYGGVVDNLARTQTAEAAAILTSQLQETLRKEVGLMEAIPPLPGVRSEHAALVRAVGDFADELDAVIARLKKGDKAAVGELRSLRGLGEIRTALAAFTSKGYDIRR